MGLDMYLEVRKYVNKVDWEASRDNPDVVTTPEYKTYLSIFPDGADKYSSVTGGEAQITVGYWRKANAIHDWFVKNCGDGEDNCQPYQVSRDDLKELLELVTKVLEHKDTEMAEEYAMSYLPPAEGFFFGAYEIDDWYWEKVMYTKDMLSHVLDTFSETGGYSFIYQASW